MITSCQSKKIVFDPQNTRKDYLVFGNGGGFTGQVTKYYLTKDGNIYAQNGEKTELTGQISKAVCTQVFSNFTTLGLEKSSLNEPGNRYYFLELKSSKISHSLKWGKSPLKDPNIENYYKILMSLVNKLNK
jgi:hypothetical protein